MLHIDGIAFSYKEIAEAAALAEFKLATNERVHVRDSRIGYREFSAANCIDPAERELAEFIRHAGLVAGSVPGVFR